MIGYTTKEFIKNIDGLDVWATKYTFKSWYVEKTTVDTRTDTIYFKGDICFALISYIDGDGKYHLIDETKYFREL